MNVLSAGEDLPRSGPDLALEEIAERLFEHIAHLGEITFADAADLDER
jgi:hypothetical protein